MIGLRALSFGAGLLLAATGAMAQSGGLKGALDKFHPVFDQAFTRHGLVGGAFAFQHAGDPATIFFFGEARQDTHQRIMADTAYNWASITKTMTAIAILQLRDRGMLSLDDPAVKYVPELRQVHDAFGPIDAITIRMLSVAQRRFPQSHLAVGLRHHAGLFLGAVRADPLGAGECHAALHQYRLQAGFALELFQCRLCLPGPDHRAADRRRLRSLCHQEYPDAAGHDGKAISTARPIILRGACRGAICARAGMAR